MQMAILPIELTKVDYLLEFFDMYNHRIKDKAIWMDRAGNEFSEDEAYGCKAIYKII